MKSPPRGCRSHFTGCPGSRPPPAAGLYLLPSAFELTLWLARLFLDATCRLTFSSRLCSSRGRNVLTSSALSYHHPEPCSDATVPKHLALSVVLWDLFPERKYESASEKPITLSGIKKVSCGPRIMCWAFLNGWFLKLVIVDGQGNDVKS